MEEQVYPEPTPLEIAVGEQLASLEIGEVKQKRRTEAILTDYAETMRGMKPKKKKRTRRGRRVLVSGFFRDL